MINSLTVIALICSYIVILFLVARWVERRASQGKNLGNNAFVYSLSLAVYCTSWTFYGSVGNAATSGMLFVTTYLGPLLSVILWWHILPKIIRIKNDFHITSIADFISARYDRSQSIAAIATIIALAGIIPYMALQLKAVITTFGLLIEPERTTATSWAASNIGPLVVVLMTIFTIIFGVRRLDPTERHQGMVVALAVESIVKLVAFLAVGLFVTYFMFDGFGDIFRRMSQNSLDHFAHDSGISSPITWLSYLLLSMSAILFLPRQFHIAIIENFDERHVRTAMWLFPLYLFLISLFVYPIAQGGLLLGFPVNEADSFVIGLPLLSGLKWLPVLVFIGGFSAATGMIMISSMTMSTMMTNHLILPLAEHFGGYTFLRRRLLHCRWLAVALYISISYWFAKSIGASLMLSNMGVISFTAALQFAPAVLGGIFWEKGSKNAARLALTAGFLVWLYTLIVPAFSSIGSIFREITAKGPWGIAFLRPEHLFGVTRLDPVSHAVFWTMFFNIGMYLLGSLIWTQTDEEQALAVEFVSPHSLLLPAPSDPRIIINVEEKKTRLTTLLCRYFPEKKASETVNQCMSELNLSGQGQTTVIEMAELLKSVEKKLGGMIGSAAAHHAITSEAIFTSGEKRELSKIYGFILANLKLSPSDVKERIDYYQERAALLTQQARLLEEKIKERDTEIAVRNTIEHALRESEERYRTLVNNVNIGVYRNTGDAIGRFIQANPAMARMLGYDSVEEVLAVPVAGLYRDSNKRKLFIEEVKKFGQVHNKELLLKKRDGTPLWASCSATVQYDDDGNIRWIDGVIEDITERKKLEEQFRHAQKMEAVGTLAGGVAHDFNNILTAIIGYGELIKTDSRDNVPIGQYIDSLLSSAKKASVLTKSLLAFSRKQQMIIKPVKLNEIVNGIEKLLRPIIREDIELETKLAEKELIIMADSGQIEQVIMNLATNARDAMPYGGILSLTTSLIEINEKNPPAFAKSGQYALLTVSDTGGGIDDKTKQRIFEPFFTTKEVGKGTGLGLSTAYGIIKQHEGEIEVSSELNKGTVFRIYMPLIMQKVEPEILNKSVAVPPHGWETILLAEDDEEVSRLIRHVLSNHGYKIIEATDGVDAIEKFNKNRHIIDILILDSIMPKKNGREVYEEITKITPGVKVLFTSGYSNDSIYGRWITERGLHFMPKPVPPDILLVKVREVLDKS